MIYGGHFDIDSQKEKIKSLEQEISKENFWNDREQAEKIIKELNETKENVNSIENLIKKINDNLELIELLELEIDEKALIELEKDTKDITNKTEALNLLLLLNGPYDKNACILEIHPGAGGTESCDWALMLYCMYTRWCEQKKYKIEVLDYQDGDEAGLKSVSIRFCCKDYSFTYQDSGNLSK